MNADITSALIDLVLAVTTIVGGALITLIRRHFSVKQINLAEQIAHIAVSATEQMAKSAGWDSGQKLRSALGDARDLGEKHGVKLSDEQWRTLLEQEVSRLHRMQDVLTSPAPATSRVISGELRVASSDPTVEHGLDSSQIGIPPAPPSDTPPAPPTAPAA